MIRLPKRAELPGTRYPASKQRAALRKKVEKKEEGKQQVTCSSVTEGKEEELQQDWLQQNAARGQVYRIGSSWCRYGTQKKKISTAKGISRNSSKRKRRVRYRLLKKVVVRITYMGLPRERKTTEPFLIILLCQDHNEGRAKHAYKLDNRTRRLGRSKDQRTAPFKKRMGLGKTVTIGRGEGGIVIKCGHLGAKTKFHPGGERNPSVQTEFSTIWAERKERGDHSEGRG